MSSRVQEASTSETEQLIGLKVVEALAEAEGVAVDELDPIYDYIDLDALDALVSSATPDLTVSWFVDGHRIEVDGLGTVRVE